MVKNVLRLALGLALVACSSSEEPQTILDFKLEEQGAYAVQYREADGSFTIVDTLVIQGADRFVARFDTTRLLSFIPLEGNLPVVHAVVGPNKSELVIDSEGLISGNAENNWLGVQRKMQLDLIAFIDSLDRIREGYSDSITFNGLSVLDSVFGAYADGYRQRILDSLAAAPQRLSNLLTQYHRIGREPVVDYSADKALFDGMKEALQEKYPMAPDVTVFSNQINEYREAQVFTDQVIDSEDKFQPGAYFPELFLQSVNGSSTHLKRNSLDNHVVLVWASWCSECRLQHISAIKEGADQSNWIYLSLDGLESQRNAVAEWQSAILQDGLEGLQLSDLGGQKSSVISTLGVRTLPLYFRVVDGKILKRTNSLQEALK